MSQSISDNKNSVGRPVTTGTGTMIGLRLHEPMLQQLDQWAKDFAPGEKLSRPEIIRRIIAEHIQHCGY